MSNFRRSLLVESRKHNIFAEAYFYLPFKDAQTVVDVNHGISSSANTGNLMSDGYYVNGNNQELTYTDSRVTSLFDSDFTMFLEFVPQSVMRNFYFLCIDNGRSRYAHILGMFVYYSKNNKFGITVNKTSSSTYIDDELNLSNSVVYESNYKICVKWEITSTLSIWVNGEKCSYNFSKENIATHKLVLGKNPNNTTRGTKGTFKSFAVWNQLLTDEECLKLTI